MLQFAWHWAHSSLHKSCPQPAWSSQASANACCVHCCSCIQAIYLQLGLAAATAASMLSLALYGDYGITVEPMDEMVRWPAACILHIIADDSQHKASMLQHIAHLPSNHLQNHFQSFSKYCCHQRSYCIIADKICSKGSALRVSTQLTQLT